MTALDLAILAIHVAIVYAWAIFPVLLALASRGRSGAGARPANQAPRVTVILSAYNEEEHIAQRVQNLQELDYPESRLRVLIGIDGAKDRTAAEARQAAEGHPNISILEFAQNRGKVSVLKDLVAAAQRDGEEDEILVFTDANTQFDPRAMRRLIEPLSDPAVGGVCGKLVFVRPEGGRTRESAYWLAENWLKDRESIVDSCLGANGAIYAIRSRLFWREIPSNTIIDDFVIGMKVREQGYRMLYEPAAIAVEELPARIRDEWKRRVRIGAGDYQALRLCRACLSPSYGAFAWMFWSHKILRWFTPHLLLIGATLAVAGAASAAPAVGRFVVGLYATGVAAAGLGSVAFAGRGRFSGLLHAAHYLFAMQAAILVGFLRFCQGNLEGCWERTERARYLAD